MAEPLDPAGLGEEEEKVDSSPLIPASPVPTLTSHSSGLDLTPDFATPEEGSQSIVDPRNVSAPQDPNTHLNPLMLNEDEDEDPSYAIDAAKGFVYGGLGFVESLVDLAGDAGNSAIWIAEKVGMNEEGGFRFGELELNEDWKPDTWLGSAIGGITQVAAGWALTAATLGVAAPASIAATASVGLQGAASLSRYGRFLQWAAFTKGTKLGRMRRGMTVGGIADFIAFKEHEHRLSNLIEEWPVVGNVVTQYLAADKDDNWLEGRLKNVVEGMGLGLLAEFVFLPFMRNQKAIYNKLDQGKFDEAMELQRQAGPEFLERLKEIRNGEEVIVLHNEDVFRQYLTLLPDMDPSKMATSIALMRTAARLHNFEDLNSFLQQGMRTSTLNSSLPAGALQDIDPSIFTNINHVGRGKEGPLGDGTAYALFEQKSFKGIENILNNKKNKEGLVYSVHTRTTGSEVAGDTVNTEKIYIVPGMSIQQAQQIAVDGGKGSFVTHKGIHQVVDEAGLGQRWKIRPLKDVEVSESGIYSFKDAEGKSLNYDLKYSDELQESIPSQHGDELTYGQTVNTKRAYKKLSLPVRPNGDLPEGALEREFVNLNDVLKIFNGVDMHNVDDAMAMLDIRPEYLDHVTKFLEHQKTKALNGRMTVRDVMKASLMTVGSQQSAAKSWVHRGAVEGAKNPEGVRWRMLDSMKHGIRKVKRDKKNKIVGRMRREAGSKVSRTKMKAQYDKWKTMSDRNDVSEKFMTFVEWVEKTPSKGASWSRGGEVGGARAFEKSKHMGKAGDVDDMVRPEEFVGLWLMSPNGRLALDALEKDEILTELWEELRHLRAAMGSDALSNTNLLPRALRKMRAGPGSARQLVGETNKLNIAELKDVTVRFNRHLTGKDPTGMAIKGWKKEDGWNTEVIGNLFKEVSGIADAKEGFMKHYLGIGDTATIDSAQLRFWLTGLKKAEKGAKGSVAEMQRMLYSRANKMFKGKNRDLFLARVKKKQDELLDRMRKSVDKDGKATNRDLTAHVLHHWLWDKVMQAESLTPSARIAMTYAQTGPQGALKGAVTFAGDGEMVLHLFTKRFADRYGRSYEASDFSTIVHEISHIYRRAMKDPIALRRKMAGQDVKGFREGPSHAHTMVKIEEALGVKGGKWTREHEEKFAEMFESWIMKDGKVPAGLEAEFKQMKGWMQELYRNVHNSPMKHRITPEIQGFFSRIFGREGLPTFLTPTDHANLAESFSDAIKEGAALEDALEQVGLNLRLWSNETDAEDVMEGLTQWLRDYKDENGLGILERYKNSLGKPGEGGLGPRRGDIFDVNTQFNSYTEGLAKDMADSFGADNDQLLLALRQNIAPEDLPEHLVAGKILMGGYSKSIYQLAEKVAAGEGGEMGAATLKILQSKFVDVYSSVMRIQRGAARTVQAGRIATEGMDPDDMYQIIMNSGGLDKIRTFAKDIITGGDAQRGMANLKQLRQQSKNQLFWDLTHEWRINGLLSSLKSLAVDLTSTTIHTVLLPMERMAGGFLMGDRELIKEGASLYYGYASALKEAMRIGVRGKEMGPFWKAIGTERQVIDPMVRTSETLQNAWSKGRIQQVFPEARGYSAQGILAGFFHYAGFWVRWPSRLRVGSKELFDQVAYRARFRQILMKQALNKFDSKTQQHLIAKYVVDNFESGFDAMGRGLNKDALQYAREVNFSEPLVDGIGAAVQNWKYRSPAAGLLVPFVRTPTWLIRGFIGRSFGGAALLPGGIGEMVTTLNPALKAIRQDFLAGGARRARALGKVNSAAVFYGAAVVLAYEGAALPGGGRARIVGSGPPDPAQRKIWEAGGKLANSVEITDAQGNKKYVSFDRLDPFWMFFGMAADYVQLANYLTDDQKEDIAGFATLALTNRLDGAYMKGAIDAAGAWSEGGGKLWHFMANMGKSFVRRADILPIGADNPLSGIPGLEGTDDEFRRERESVHGAWMTIFPWTWDKYGVKYDTITGKPIKKREAWGEGDGFWGNVAGEVSPFLYSESRAKDNPMSEIAEMLYGFGPPSPQKSLGGQDLDLRDLDTNYEDETGDGIRIRNIYQAWQKEIGKVGVEKQLNSLMKGSGWKSSSRDEKVATVKHTLRNLRNMAFGNLISRYPDIRKQVMEARINRYKEKKQAVMSQRLSSPTQ